MTDDGRVAVTPGRRAGLPLAFFVVGACTVPGILLLLWDEYLQSRGDLHYSCLAQPFKSLFAGVSLYVLIGWVLTGLVVVPVGLGRGAKPQGSDLAALAVAGAIVVWLFR